MQIRHLLHQFQHPLAVQMGGAIGECAGAEFDDDPLWLHNRHGIRGVRQSLDYTIMWVNQHNESIKLESASHLETANTDGDRR
jgi:hypothetical protein